MRVNGRFAVIVMAACPLVATAADSIKPLDVKLGLWESTTASQSSNAMAMLPPEMLAKMTPEQRARMEAAAKAREAKGPQAHTQKSCLTKESLTKMSVFGEDQKGCQRTVIRSSSSAADVRLDCSQGGMIGSGEFHVEAVNSENVKGTIQVNGGPGGKSAVFKTSFTAHWLGPDCGDVK